MNKSDLIGIRAAVEGDRNLILATWLRGLYYGCSLFTEVPKNTFMAAYHDILERLLASNNVKVTIACLRDDPDVIVGYSVTNRDGTIVHWVFTKSNWRNIGIAKSLVSPTAKVATHITKVGLSLLRKRSGAIYNPFAIAL